jgi:uncharacterized protein
MSGFLGKVAVAGCVLAFFGALTPLRAQQIQVNKDNRTIAVTTNADAEAPADTATVHIGFVAYGQDEQTAYANGSKVSNSVTQALSGAGVPADSIQSENQSVTPVPEYGNQNWSAEERVERKFQVQQSWLVKTSAKDAARVLDVAVKAGANQSGQIDWSVADDDALEAKAAGLALARARRIAEQMAQGLHVGLGGLIYASNQTPAPPVVPMMRMSMAAPAPAPPPQVAPLAISAQKVTRSATVYAVFAIQ